MKTFKDCYKIDVTPYVDLKPTFYRDRNTGKTVENPVEKHLSYLPWSRCLELLYFKCEANEVIPTVLDNEDGYPAFFDANGQNPFVKIEVEIDGKKAIERFPVMQSRRDGTISALNIYNGTQRGFVKCVAKNWGLGLALWLKEEKELEQNSENTPPPVPADQSILTDAVKKDIMALTKTQDINKYYVEHKSLAWDANYMEFIKDHYAKIAKIEHNLEIKSEESKIIEQPKPAKEKSAKNVKNAVSGKNSPSTKSSK